jgi:DNA invertase Pin-like site-specific DNA recombinase
MQKVVRGTQVGKELIPRIESLVPVIGYIRVSTWREEAISDEIQMAAITEATARAGRHVVRWVPDLDATGRNFKRRIMEAIAAVEAREVPEIWVWKFSRFGRSRHGVAINLARVEHVGGELKSATEDIDATTATGRFARGMLFEVAAFESDRAGEQWRETHQLRRAAGVPATGGRRSGYIWHPRRIPDARGGWTTQEELYEVDPEPAERMLHAYRDHIAGRAGFGKIAQRFNADGFLNTRSAVWSVAGVRAALDSGFSAGLLYVHRRDVRCGDRGKCHQWDDHWTHIPAEHEAIISGDEWDAYRERRQKRNTAGWSVTPSFPLSGLTRCALCGAAATANTGGRAGVPGYSYRCGACKSGTARHESIHVLRSVVEDAVHGWLLKVKQHIDDRAAGRVALPEQPAEQPDAEVERGRLVREISGLTAELDRATAGHIKGIIPEDSYVRTRDRLLGERAAKETALAELQREESREASPAGHAEVIEGLLTEWLSLPVDQMRFLLSRVIYRVELGRGTIDLFPSWDPERPERVRG